MINTAVLVLLLSFEILYQVILDSLDELGNISSLISKSVSFYQRSLAVGFPLMEGDSFVNL